MRTSRRVWFMMDKATERSSKMRWREKVQRKKTPARLPEQAEALGERLVRQGVMSTTDLEEARELGSIEEWAKKRIVGFSPERPTPVADEEEAWAQTGKAFQGHLAQDQPCQEAARGDKRPFREHVEVGVEEYDGQRLIRHTLRCPYCTLVATLYYTRAAASLDFGDMRIRLS
jgi:hypothetical protein